MPQKLSLGLEEDDNLSATIYGIISDLPDYRMAFFLNKDLGLRLTRKAQDRTLYHPQGEVSFSEFEYHEPVRLIDWSLTSNHGLVKYDNSTSLERSGLSLVEAWKSINYFLWYPDNKNLGLHKHIFEALRTNPYVRVVQELPLEGIKNIENLISQY